MIQEQPFALVVSSGNDWRIGLEEFLTARQIDFGSAHGLGEVAAALDHDPPEVIITAEDLPDGTWHDIADLVVKAPVPVNIVVVAERRDNRPYLSAAIDCGAFDFIHPPIAAEGQACVIQVAARDTRRRRKERELQTLV